ncbi:MAG: Gfo/Idh/MocA family oxidoreductase [Rhodobacteraceae bacterium]|jgi:predicted dehydrogenase|nr:Gfo/Idh/MocA family oxidoreductase [Paracoccaceae bacterium]
MTDHVRWGILGAAKFARDFMAPALHAAKGARLEALATSDPAKADGFRAFAPDLRVHATYDALLADPLVDAVYIPLPNHLHVEWTEKALLAGKHVLTEKPIAMQADQIDRLIALRDQTGLVAAEAYMIVHHPQWQRAKALLQDGAIGQLLHVDGFFSYDNRADPANIRNRADTGGGSARDIGVYTMGSARWATGEEPVRVTAETVWENGVEVTAHVIAHFPSFRFQATTSMRMHPRQEMTFHGTDGVLRLTAPYNANVFGQAEVHLAQSKPPGGQGARVTVERFPADNHYVHQVEAFGRSVRDGVPFAWTLENAKGTQAMIDRVLATT